MSSTFFGLNVAYTGLDAQRRALDVVGYNIAHANDPAYKRQQLNTSEATTQSSTAGGAATTGGVVVGDVERIRDALIENRLRAANNDNSEWQYKSQAMQQLESTIGEPSDTGLQSDLDEFWSAWQKVSTSPESLPIRSSLLDDASALCQRIQYEYSQMSSMASDLNSSVVDRVDQINQLGSQIAALNQQIDSVQLGQVTSNDLENTRDSLVDQLSKLVSVTQSGDGKDSYVVSIGGRVLVQGDKFNALTCQANGGNQIVQWASDGQALSSSGGELNAILEMRDQTLPSYLSQLNDMASSLVQQVNAVHTTGKTLSGADAGDFFKAGTTAANICLDSSIVDHPELVGASATGAVGDGDKANAIAAVQNLTITNGLTIDGLYRKLVGDIGSAASAADKQAAARQLAVDQYSSQQQSVSGVNMDEEMTNMIKYQQAYNASARMITVMDQMLTTLIQQTGVS